MPPSGECHCTPLVETRACPECGHEVVTAVPFTKSGRASMFARACPTHYWEPPSATLTELARVHFEDSRGHIPCPDCGLVLDDDGPELVAGSPREDSSRWASSPNHFSRIANELAGFDVARARRAYRGALSSRDRHRARRLAGILYDVDILCARLDVKGDLKSEVSRTVEAYYTGAKRSGTGARSEAVLTAITLEVLNRRAWGDADLADAAFTVFNITPTQRHLATMRIRDWFNQNSEWRK